MEDLGGRLAAETPPTPDDLQKLARFQADYQPSLEEVVAVLRDRLHITSSGLFDGVALTTTSRPGKTIETLREKLRKGIPLRVIQDITGLRVVGDLRLSQQNDLRDQIKKCFAGSRVDEDDRRVTPSSGYRAVHLIPVVLGLPVEIQLRTASQDAWAQASEKLGDLWGRWHRYGLPPEGPTPEERERRGQFIEQYRLIGDAFYSHELVLDREFVLRRQEEELTLALERDSGSELSARLSEVRDLLEEVDTEQIESNKAIAVQVNRLVELSNLQSNQ